MKKLCVLLSLSFLFACQEAIDEIPEVIVEETASANIAEETKVTEEIEILIECLLNSEVIEIEEVVYEEVVEEVSEEIEIDLDVTIEEVQELEIVEVPETEIEIIEIPRNN